MKVRGMVSLFIRLLISGVIIFTICALVSSYFCPIFNGLPAASGQYFVGTTQQHYSVNQQNRVIEFNVDIFYPTDIASKKTFPYQLNKINALKSIKAESSYIPKFIWDCLLGNLYTFAQPNAVISQKKETFPVIIYLPGIGGDDLHNVYLEELASNGYIVFAIEPPYDIAVTVFPNGNIITLDKTLAKAMAEVDRTEIYKYRNAAHVRWSNYIEIVIAKLRQLNDDTESLFYQKLDVYHLGLIGHSHGGAVVTDFCQKHAICKAAINMDGWTKSYNSSQPFDTPFLFLLSEHGEMPEMQEFFSNNKRKNFQKIIITGAGHLAFNDFVLVKQPIAWWFGEKNSVQVRKQISEYIVSFFDKYLKNN